jgi:hypothetical protein
MHYGKNPFVKAVIERKFLVIGEAVDRLRNECPGILINALKAHNIQARAASPGNKYNTSHGGL